MGPRRLLRLFGAPGLFESDGTPLPKLGAGKPLAVLAYLLVEGPTSRDTLVALLWGDVPEEKARNAFRQALHRLRAALGEHLIPHDPDIVQVADDGSLTSDLAAFENALRDSDTERALQEYRGEFLAGVDVTEPAFEQWVAAKRARFRARFIDALRVGLQRDLETGATNRALEKASQLAATAPLDVDIIVQYASTLLASGRRAEALHALDDFGERYQRELQKVAPPAVRELAVRLRRAPIETAPRGAGRRSQAGFVGRESELAIVLGKWRQVEAGTGGVLFLEGDPGIGKTRIIEEFFARTKDVGSPLLLLGHERSPGSAIPYASIAEALRDALSAPGLAGTSQHLLAEASRLLPQLRDQFTLPDVANVHDDASRLRFFEGVAALLDSVAYEQPVCLALDDFHNCSTATSDLAYYLIERLRAAPILFVLAARPSVSFSSVRGRFLRQASGSGDPRRLVTDDGHYASLELGPLDGESARKLVHELAGGRLTEETVGLVVAVSGGLPYLLVEASERAFAGEPLGGAPVPLRDVLWARLHHCNQAQQRLFVASALLDRPASIRLLAGASHLAESSALDAALALEKEGLLIQRADGVMPAHDFAAELALEGAGPAGRALLAGWAADALQREGGASDAELATLFAAAGRRDQAFKHSRSAGYAAAALGAVSEALRHFEVAAATAGSESGRAEMMEMSSTLRGGLLRLAGQVHLQTEPEKRGLSPDSRGSEEAAAERASAPPDPVSQSEPRRTSKTIAVRSPLVRAVAVGVAVVVTLIGMTAIAKSRRSAPPGTSLSDTLLVAEEISPRVSVIAYTTGPIGSPASVLAGATKYGRSASWIDSLRLPWINPRPSPTARFVALERMSESGPDLYAVSADRRDTIPVAVGPGDDISAGWSPDGRWLLATHGEMRSDGAYASNLYAYSIGEPGRRVALDTSASRAVVDAAWSPDGTRIAWTARVGSTHQQEVFVSDADGRNLRNISDDPSEDYSIAWSPGGERIAFTSERTGHAELYSVELETRALRRLTRDAAHADHASFSPDGRWMAYESTRGGRALVYVMPSWGGIGRNVAPGDKRIFIVGWRGETVSFVDRVVIEGSEVGPPGGRQPLVAREYDQFGKPLPVRNIEFHSLESAVAEIEGVVTESEEPPLTARAILLGRTIGLARIEASAGSWRADTAFIRVGTGALPLLHADFESGIPASVWLKLGVPSFEVAKGVGHNGSAGLLARSDRQWESGILSRKVFPIQTGLTVSAWVRAPFDTLPAPGGSFVVAFVAADPVGVPDSIAPQFLRLAAVSLLRAAARVSYSVDREVFTEPVARLGIGAAHKVGIRVEADGTVGFYVDGVWRWRSTLKLKTSGENSRAQLWLGSQSSAGNIVFDDLSLMLEPAQNRRP